MNARYNTSGIVPHHPMHRLCYDRYLNAVFWQYRTVFIRSIGISDLNRVKLS